MNLTEITDKIQEKLGKEESGKIADDILLKIMDILFVNIAEKYTS